MSKPVPLALAGLIAAGAAHAADDPLAKHRWRERVLVVVAAASGDPRIETQRRLYAAARAGMRERDLVLLEAVGSGPQAAALRTKLGVRDRGFTVVLVGKDGGPKLRSDEPIPSERLFETVDAMPMRREELRRRPS